ncbi:MAG: hypothetical protein NW241_16290 [Bacteroidia bacterium]|nr:hypothetical protein [Bacteroidia bacterium]
MKTFISFLLLLACVQTAGAQKLFFRTKPALSVNMGVHIYGTGHPRVCFEQEAVYWLSKGVAMGFRLGAGRLLPANFGWAWDQTETTSVVAAAYVCTGRKNHHFEAALGPEFWIDGNEYGPPLVPYAEAGYRFQRPGGVLFVRSFAGITSGLGLGFGLAFQ